MDEEKIQGKDEAQARRPRGPLGVLWAVFDFAWPFALAIGLALLLRTFVIELFVVPTGSMLDTIQLNDTIFVEKLSLYGGSPTPGEVVTLENPENPKETLVKRVIATGGQTIDLVDGRVVVDGEELVEPYTEGKPTYPFDMQMYGIDEITYPYTVPEGCVWLMGDNRTNSRDSRFYGPVSEEKVFGHALAIIWPLDDAGAL